MSDTLITALGWVGSFIAGFLVRTFIPTSKERFDIHSKRTENSKQLKDERDQRYQAFERAFHALRAAKTNGSGEIRDAFWGLRKAGDLYFETFETIAQYIRRGQIDTEAADNDHVPEIEKLAFKTIPKYYEVLSNTAKKHGLPWSDKITDSTFRNVRLVLKGRIASARYQELLAAWRIQDPLDH